MNNYKSIRTTITKAELVESLEQLQYETDRSQSDIVKEALKVYLLEDSQDTQLSVSKK